MGAVRLEIWPEVMRASSWARKAVARLCLWASKALRAAFAVAWSSRVLVGLGSCGLMGRLRGEVDGEGKTSESLKSESPVAGGGDGGGFRGERWAFRGECWSFQELTRAALQNASTLGRCGVGGILGFFFVGEARRGLLGLAGPAP